MDNDLLRFTLSHCVDQVERLLLIACGITNEIVEQLAETIKNRQKPVKYYTEFNECLVVKMFAMPSLVIYATSDFAK